MIEANPIECRMRMTFSRLPIEPEVFDFFDYKRYTFSLGLKSDDGAWLSGHSASRFEPRTERITVDGEMGQQAIVAHDKIESILAAAGYTWQNVVKINDYVTVAGLGTYDMVSDVRHDRLGGHRPATTTIVVDRLLRPAAFIETEVVASANPAQVFEVNSAPGAVATRIGDLVYVSGQVATDEGGEIPEKIDLVAQTKRTYENVERLLHKAGVSTKQIVKTVDWVVWSARGDYRQTGRVRKEMLSEPYPAATGIVVSRLPHPDALIQVDAIAYDGEREIVNPGWGRYQKLTYNPAIRAGDYLFLAGQFSMDPVTEQPEYVDDIVSQTRNVYTNLLKVMDAVGLDEKAMVKTVEYVVGTGLPEYRKTAAVREELFSAPYPSATGCVIPQLLWPGMLIEVDSIARFR